MRSRLHSFNPISELFFRVVCCVCNIYVRSTHLDVPLRFGAITCSGRGGARAKSEDSNACFDPPTGARLVMSAAGTDERAPLLLGADAASGGWGWRKRALAGLAILGTVAACVCAVAATGAPLLPSTIARASRPASLPSIRALRSSRPSRRASRAEREPRSRPNLAKTRVTPHPHLVQTSVATDFSSTPAELPGDVHAAFVDPTRPRVPL